MQERSASRRVMSTIRSLDWSPDGSTLAASSDDNQVRLWNVVTHERTGTLSIPWGRVQSVVWSSDGTLLATGGEDSIVRLWDSTTGELLAELHGHPSDVWSVAWSPNGSRLASGNGYFNSPDGNPTVRLWGLPS